MHTANTGTTIRFVITAALTVFVSNSQSITTFGVTTTETQAVIRYDAPDSNPCTVQISESMSLSPPVHDVDPALFPGSNLDSRMGSVSNGPHRVFVAGKRDAERAADGRR